MNRVGTGTEFPRPVNSSEASTNFCEINLIRTFFCYNSIETQARPGSNSGSHVERSL